MGHTRLGKLPTTQKWLDLVRRIAGSGVSGGVLTAASYVEVIAAQTLEASRAGLDNAKHDSGVLYAFFLLTSINHTRASILKRKDAATTGSPSEASDVAIVQFRTGAFADGHENQVC